MEMGKMLMSAVSVLFVTLFLNLANGQDLTGDPLVVRTAEGYLKGSILISRKGKSIYSFRGVRFAQPPVGNRRFKAPVPLEPWDGVKNATADGFACPQPEANTTIPTSEDCLFLNVYTTELPSNGSNPNRSVMVFFHAGGWFSVTGVSAIYGPQYLMDQDIVLVTTNYRLAALGFLSTGDEVLPGNYGMKDQVATLRWVKENIAAFGGNPDSVTIAGYSVGGASVWLHMISPMSRGLFHRAISMSPSINTFWDVNGDPLTQAKKQAAVLNCPNNTSRQIIDCLMQKSAQEIASTYGDMLDWGYDPILFYTPVIEQESDEEQFLTESPMKSLLDDVISNSSWAEDMYERFDEVSPIAFMYEKETNKSYGASHGLKEFYLHNEPITLHSLTGLGNLYSDAIIRYGQHLTSKLVSSRSKEPVFSYLFEYQGRYSHAYWPRTQNPYGVVHHDDLIYLFYISTLFPEFKAQDPESQMVEKLTQLWANFVQTGNPTPEKSELLDNVTWERMTAENLAYLSIGHELKMDKGMFEDHIALWEQLFPPQ
ncbi:esterase FE4 isoform X2 [Cryptotermes secundus]|uniref:esterase FE4 isoform X2 n=1 Tax=Cryptotermes secundus TaxID=105785 RepID=UPI000CD7C8DC|nr:esterase FE4 isoform X2 [Cryptotermes secundus]